MNPNNTIGPISVKIAEGLATLFERVNSERRNYYRANPERRPKIADVDELIRAASYECAGIAGGGGILPGPLGAIASVPEAILVTRRQLILVYDIAVAHGKENVLDGRFLLGMLASFLGGGKGGIISFDGGTLVVRRLTMGAATSLIGWVAKKMTQRLWKRFLTRFFPIVGAAVLANWARDATWKLGRFADEQLGKSVVMTGDTVDENGLAVQNNPDNDL